MLCLGWEAELSRSRDLYVAHEYRVVLHEHLGNVPSKRAHVEILGGEMNKEAFRKALHCRCFRHALDSAVVRILIGYNAALGICPLRSLLHLMDELGPKYRRVWMNVVVGNKYKSLIVKHPDQLILPRQGRVNRILHLLSEYRSTLSISLSCDRGCCWGV